MKILLPGQYPRSEKLVAATRDYDRKRVSAEVLEKAQHEDVQSFKELQKNLPYLSPGLFNFQDLLRPIADIVDNCRPGTLTRFFETNTFWHLLEFEGKPSFNESKSDKWIEKYFLGQGAFSKESPIVFTLPFIYLFKEFSTGISIENIANLLEILAKKLLSLPGKTLCFCEPTLGWRPLSNEEKKAGISLLENIKKSVKGPVYIYGFFFSLEKEKDFFYSLPADGYGIDFYANSISGMLDKFPKEKTLLAGILNTDSTLIEKKKSIDEFRQILQSLVPEERVFLTPSGPAELLPRTIMDKKVKNIKEIIS